GVTLGDVVIQAETVTNTSGSTVMIGGDSLSGEVNDFAAFPDFGCPYLDQNTLVITLPAGQSCNIDYFFNPGALGGRSATITLLDNSVPGNPLASTSVSGTGTIGYYQVSSTGKVAHFGDALFYGDASQTPLSHPVEGITQTGDDGGYWLVANDGGVFNYGDAGFFGSAGGIRLNKPIVGMAASPDSMGYWLVATDGGIFNYGDAQFFGSTGSIRLNRPIVGMAATNSGNGYWLVASDGGIFSYGDARFYGSTGSIHLNQPIVGMAATPDDGGYWLVASDGGIFAYGDAQFFGSTGAIHLAQPIVGMAAMPDGSGYWFTAADGGLFNYGAPFYGAANSQSLSNVVGMATDGAPTAQAISGVPAIRHALTGNGNQSDWTSQDRTAPRFAGR
ncbi:MAG TPA: hypothetical protein VNV83_04295, partial [Acidimicrobiales bacterium]|nr:hypothetical protein [Acidimicrobiales bacterium]